AAAGPGAPLYSRIPTADEMRRVEPSLTKVAAPSFGGLGLDAVPWFLTEGGSSIATSGSRFPRCDLVLGRALAQSAFAFVSLFESGGRKYGVSADMAVVPLDRLTRVSPSAFHGLPLDDTVTLPVVFARSSSVSLYSGDPLTGLAFARKLDRR